MQDLNISTIQTNLEWENPYQNLENLEKRLNEISNNPDVIVLPEMFNTGFTMNVNKCAEREAG